MLNELLKEERKLNTITKYPSILTYHELGKKGTIVEEPTQSNYIPNDDELLEATEKVDGTNTRIVICGKDYLIGMREDFLYAKGDRIINDKMGVLQTNIDTAERLVNEYDFSKDELFVVYGETYGKGINKGYKNYSTEKLSFRVFDMWKMSIEEVNNLIYNNDLNTLSTWRENYNQPYVEIEELKSLCNKFKLEKTPVLFSTIKKELPNSIEDMYEMLSKYKDTLVNLDGTKGKSEGFVLRNSNRKYIKKIRFEEYEKTLKIR